MNIYFYPQYSGLIYYGLNVKNSLDFDAKALDTEGLVDFFSLHAGLIYPAENKGERIRLYGDAIRNAIAANSANIFADSFKVDPLNTTLQCLKWRDVLRLTKWNDGIVIQSSPMIESLREIEYQLSKLSNNYPCDLADKIDNLISKLSQKGGELHLPNEAEIKICLPCPKDFLHPLVIELLDSLTKIKRNKKAVVKIVEPKVSKSSNDVALITKALLDPEALDSAVEAINENRENEENSNLEIISFDDLNDATRYVTYLKASDYNVWINTSNDKLPYYIKNAGLPDQDLSGCQGFSQTRQLLIAGLNLFFTPLNLEVLMQWLSLPIHPLESDFRKDLIKLISNSDSLYNAECKNLITQYANQGKKYADAASVFIPNVSLGKANSVTFNTNISKYISLPDLTMFLNKLKKWTSVNLGAGFYDPEVLSELPKIGDDIDLVLECLKLYSGKISRTQLANIIQLIYDYPNTTSGRAVVGSKAIINSPELIAADGTKMKTIWCDFYNDPSKDATYGFLNTQEIADLKNNGMLVWDKEKEIGMYRYFQIIPFIKSSTGKLTLVTCERDGGVKFQKHPFMSFLESLIKQGAIGKANGKEALNKIVETTQMNKAVENTLDPAADPYYYIFQLSGKLKWPQITDDVYPATQAIRLDKRYCESYSSINELIYNPLSYAFKYLGGIKERSVDALSPIYRLEGNVVHKVIETLLTPQIGKKGPYNNQYSDKQIEGTFNQTIDEMALLLRAPEHTTLLSKFWDKAKKSVRTLLEIIDANGLTIGGCEEAVEDIKFFTASNIRKIDANSTFSADETADKGFLLNGSIDMWLYKDTEDGRKYYLFDFKWTAKEDKYISKLQENKSIQLCLYKHALIHHLKYNGVIINESDIVTAYYILSSSKLYTCSTGINQSVCITMDNDRVNTNLFEEIMNSYEFRKSEIQNGCIEDAENIERGLSAYSRNEKKLHLLPLDYKSKNKKEFQLENAFNEYTVFTSKR